MTQTTHNNFDLSIRFTPDGFYLSVSENGHPVSSKKVQADFNNFTETEIIDVLAAEPELQMVFKTVRLVYETNHYTFVPVEFFTPENANDFLIFQHPRLPKNHTVLYNNLEPWDAVNVFAMPSNLHKVLNNFLPEIAVEHHLTTLLTDQIVMQNGKMLHVQVRSNETDFVVLHDSKLLLVNTFQVTSIEDTVYHTLNIATQLALNTDECKVTVHGQENLQSCFELLSKYFDNCNLSELRY